MKKHILLPLILISACQSKRPIYETSSYELYPDMIVQGEYIGVAETPYRIVSDLYGDTLVWECRNDLSSMPSLETPYLLEEAVYNMALDESINAVEPDGTLRTGLFWGGVWTRDVSYSTILGMAYIQPRAAMTSLLCKIGRNGQIIQDTGTGGAWPCSSDREVWTVAAWELYKVTGDEEWLRTVYPVAKKSLEVDMKTLYDPVTGLVRGESSFIDWREQSYPRWMEPADIYDSKCLGTNVVHYAALVSAAEMASLLEDHEFAGICTDTAAELRKAINEWLWMPEYGYYAQFIAGREDDMLFTRSETLGQALSVIFGVADAQRADVIGRVTNATGEVPKFNADGELTSTGFTLGCSVPADAVFTDTVYTPPTYGANTSGFYKFATDANGYVSSVTAVTLSDLTGLGAADTQYVDDAIAAAALVWHGATDPTP